MKLFKIILSSILVLALSTALFGCVSGGTSNSYAENSDPPAITKTDSEVQIITPPNGVTQFNDLQVKVENTPLPLYGVYVNNEHSWSPNPTNRDLTGVGYFSLNGKTKITVTGGNITSCTVRPLSAGVKTEISEGVARFTLKSAGNYAVELNDDPETAIFLFVSDIEADENPTGRVIRFEKGLHTTETSPHIFNDTVTLTSNTTVIFDEGAVVRARFVANNAENITLKGKGVIDGSAFTRNASTGEVKVPLDFNYCKNLNFSDFSVLDPAGWCVNWYFCEDSEIDGIKIISSRSNGDGISLQSCKRIEVKNCFLRTWDDSLVVKNYPKWENRAVEGSTEDIRFENCTVWTDLAQSMEIGYETVGKTLTRVYFTNITVLHNFHKPVISIHNGNNARISEVYYDTITVEDGSMGRGDAGSNNQLLEFTVEHSPTWSNQHKVTALGSVNSVSVKNLTMLGGNPVVTMRIAGSVDRRSGYNNTVHRVDGIALENVWINGKKLKQNYAYLSINEYASVSVSEGDNPKLATFNFSKTEEELKNYTDTAKVSAK